MLEIENPVDFFDHSLLSFSLFFLTGLTMQSKTHQVTKNAMDIGPKIRPVEPLECYTSCTWALNEDTNISSGP